MLSEQTHLLARAGRCGRTQACLARAGQQARFFNSTRRPAVIRLVALMYVHFPLSLRKVKDPLFKRGIDICHGTVRHWSNRFGPLFAADIREQRVSRMRGFRQ